MRIAPHARPASTPGSALGIALGFSLCLGLGLALGLAPAVRAQGIIDAAKLPKFAQKLEAQPGDDRLRCTVTPIKPSLDYTFRFPTGYNIAVPMMQYIGPGHNWVIIERVTPEVGNPVWLGSRVVLPDVPLTTVVTDTFGGFVVGAGKYKVDWALFDDMGRVCRQQWKFEAKLSHAERHVTPSIPANTVTDFAATGLPDPPALPPGAKPFHLTVLLHAAPFSPRRLHMRSYDRLLLVSTLSGMLRRLQPTTVRLIVFNFDKQRVLYRNEDFKLAAIGDVNEELNRLELETVDVETLQKPMGHIDLLNSMISAETGAAKPSDAVVFLGPMARYFDKLPPESFAAPPEGTRFYYFQYRPALQPPPFGRPMPQAATDTISSALTSLKGRLFPIYSPGQFADAIRELERTFR
jgi:hypothetical protein